MVRVTTNNYGAATDTQFAWATSGTDLFSRTQDLYRLAQAVEFHDHGSTRGLPVARLANNAVTETSISALSVTTTKIANQAVTVDKIADGNVTDAKMTNQKVNRTGDTITGDVTIYRSGAPTTGYILLGNVGNHIGFDGANPMFSGNIMWHSGNDGVGSAVDAGLLGGQAPAFYASAASLAAGLAAVVTFPLAGICLFPGVVNITAAGSHFARFTPLDGRMIVGAGTTGGQIFAENTSGGTTWTPAASVSANNGSLGVSGSVGTPTETFPVQGGGTQVASSGHSHSISVGLSGSVSIAGNATVWFPPLYVGVWAQRVN
jgi:hypothetical protein